MRLRLCVSVLLLFAMSLQVEAAPWRIGDMDPDVVPRTVYGPGEEITLRARLEREPYRTLYASVLSSANRTFDLEVHDVGQSQNKGNIAKTAAFVYAMNRTLSGGEPVSFASEDDRLVYGRKAETLLHHMFTQSRMTSLPNMVLDIHTAQELSLYVTAYDLLRGAAYPFEDENAVIGNLAALATDFYKDWVKDQYPAVNSLVNNHASKSASALGLAAIVLNGVDLGEDPEGFTDPAAWIRWAVPLLDQVILDSLVTRDGAFGEGAPYYTYSAINHTLFLVALRRYIGVENLNAWEINGWIYGDLMTRIENQRLHDWLVKIQTPDGSFPPFDDSSPSGRYLFGQTAPLPNHPLYLWAWQRQLGYPLTPESIHQEAETLAWYDDAVAPQSPVDLGWPPNVFLYDGGSAVFRSDWEDRDARYLIMMAEHGKAKCWATTREGHPRDGAGGHDHNDPGAIHLQAYEETLLLDSGYMGWTQHNMVYNAHNHNLILIDGKGPALMHMKAPTLIQDEEGNWVIPEGQEGGYIPGDDGDAYLNDFFDLPGLAYARMDTRYFVKTPAANLSRHVWFVDDNVFIVWDEARTDDGKPHRYTILWHGNGGGTSGGDFVALPDGGVWTRPKARVMVRTQGNAPLTWEVAEDIHDPGTRQPATHNLIKGSLEGLRASLVSVLLPEPAGETLALLDYDSDTGVWSLSPAEATRKGSPLLGETRFHAPGEGARAHACGLESDARALLCRRDPDSGDLTHLSAIAASEIFGPDDKLLLWAATSGLDEPAVGVKLDRVAIRIEKEPVARLTLDVRLGPASPSMVHLYLALPFEGQADFGPALRAQGVCAIDRESSNGEVLLFLVRDSRIVLEASETDETAPLLVLQYEPEGPEVGQVVTVDAAFSCPRDATVESYALIETPSLSRTTLETSRADRASFIPDLPGVYRVEGTLRDGDATDRQVIRIEVAPAGVDEPDGDADGDIPDGDGELDGDLDTEDDPDPDAEPEDDEESPDEDGDTEDETDTEAPEPADGDQPEAADEGCGCRAQPTAGSFSGLVLLLVLVVLRRRVGIRTA